MAMYDGRKVLKVSDNSTVTAVDAGLVSVDIPSDCVKTELVSHGYVCGVDMKSIDVCYRCDKCKNPVSLSGSLAICDAFENCSTIDILIKEDAVKFTIKDDDGNKLSLFCKNSLLDELASKSINSKVEFVQEFMNMHNLQQLLLSLKLKLF